MSKWYQDLFKNYAKKYEQECFTVGTIGECDFIEQEISFNKELKILDIGCGTGRHSIELAKRGYNLTGIDLSENMLCAAKEKAKLQNLSVDFQLQDARELTFRNEFDLVIMLCEGGFPLMETDEMNFQILQNAANALKNSGKFIFTTLNGLFPLFHSIKESMDSETKEGNATYHNNTFDLMTFRDFNTTVLDDDEGNHLELECNERYYVPSEITWLLKSLKFNKIEIFGAKMGAFSRNDQITTNDFEMLVIAEK